MSGAMARRKGAVAERAVVAWLNEHGFPHAERRGAGFEASDIIGIPGVTLEIKNQKTMNLAGWVDQLNDEMRYDGNLIGAVITKRRGKSNVAEWYAVLPADVFARLLRQAGYGDPT